MGSEPITTGDEPSLGGAHAADDQHLEPGLGGEAALTHLIDAIHHQDPKIQQRAFEQLVAIGSEQAIDTLAQAAHDPNASVRGRAVRALGKIPHERAVHVLIEKLQDESQAQVRNQVIQALGETGSEHAVDPLIQKFQSDTNQAVHRYVAIALGQIGAPQAVAVLAQGLNESNLVRRVAGQAIGRIGEKHPEAIQPVVDHLLEDLFGASGSEKRYRAIAAMSNVRPAAAVLRLIEAMNDTERPTHQRRAAILALTAIGDRRAAAPLLELFATTQNSDLCRWAGEGLIVIRDRDAIPILIELLNHETWQVRRFTARILSRRGVWSAIPHLIPLLEDDHEMVREEAAEALGRLHQARNIAQAIEPLTRAQTDLEYSVGRAASMALERIRQRDREHAQAAIQAQDNVNAD